MEEAVILEDVVVEVMVVTKTAGVMGKLEPLHHNMVGATDRQVRGPIVMLSLGDLKRRHLMSLLPIAQGKRNNGPYHLSARCLYQVALQ